MFYLYAVPGYELCRKAALLCQIGQPLHPLLDAKGQDGGIAAVVQDQGVKGVALGEGSHRAEEAAATQGGHPEDLVEGKRREALVQELPAKLAGLNGMGHGPEKIQAAAPCHIGGQADPKPLLQEAADRRQGLSWILDCGR